MKYKLFLTAFVQVFLIAVQTVFLANSIYLGVIIVGFGISYIWTWNVSKVAFGTNKDKFIYACGAGCGSICGLMISKLFI